MFVGQESILDASGGTAALPFSRALVTATPVPTLDRWRAWGAATDWTPDLGAGIGTRDWWRGLATCAGLLAATTALGPWHAPAAPGDTPPALDGAAWEEARAQGIEPLAWGADSGRRMAATGLVLPLADTPERPRVELTATLGDGDRFASVLERAGAAPADAARAASLVADAASLDGIKPGTRLDMVLGRRASKSVPRPLEKLAFRARFDLALSLERAGAGMVLTRQPISIDHTPLRVQGTVGASLYRSARAAGVPAKLVETYIKALATRLSIGRDVGGSDSFDVIIERDRAATGEVQLGQLLFAGLDQGRKKVQLVRWGEDNGTQWYEASGQTERRGFMGMPVAGHITSGYGMRMHPLLGFTRFHKGLDIGAPYGSPIYAATDGVVQFAGRSGGYGNFVRLAHGASLGTGYGHMSRIAVRPGMRVARGQVIGYVGSSGLSTGPHLHWEVWKNGQAVNPRSVSFSSLSQLAGASLARFKARVAGLLAVRVGG